MELRLNLFGGTRSIDLSRLTRYRNTAVVLASVLLVIPLTVCCCGLRRCQTWPTAMSPAPRRY